MNANMDAMSTQRNLQMNEYVAVLEMNLSEQYVKNSNFSREKYKTMTLDVMDSVFVSGDTKTMHSVAGVVAKWNNCEDDWVGDLVSWAKTIEDAKELLICENGNVMEIVVVVDDSTKDHVLDYNEFLFEIRGKYDEIHDFMVLDDELRAALPAMYTQVKCIYKRGE